MNFFEEKDEKDEKDEKEEKILINLQVKIPDVLLLIIYSYLPVKVKILLNKNYYNMYHYKFYDYILSRDIESYIRDIIRRDLFFVFKYILNENYQRWTNKIKNYKYKNLVYKNYLYFIKDFCIEQDSVKCLCYLNDFMVKFHLGQNQHKKNTVRNIRWKI
jgi:hypothetical protein